MKHIITDNKRTYMSPKSEDSQFCVSQSGYGNEVPVSDGNYLGTDGTISVHAKGFGWSTDVWNLSGNVPTLN